MKEAFRKMLATRLPYLQTFFVFVAFGAMVVFSRWYVSDMESKFLSRVVDDAFKNAEIKIEADIKEPKNMLYNFARIMRGIILRPNTTLEDVQDLLMGVTSHTLEKKGLMDDFDGLYGYFPKFGNIDGQGRKFPEGLNVEERPWYVAAMEANGEIATTPPYTSVGSNKQVITFAISIFEDEEKQKLLGVIGLDITLERLGKYATAAHIYNGSYGILFDANYYVVAHPVPEYLGKSIRELNDGPAIENVLRKGIKFEDRKVIDFRDWPAICSIRPLKIGDQKWYLAVLTPEETYYENARNIRKNLIVIGLISSVLLSLILVRMITSRIRTDEYMQMMLDATPLCMNLWNDKYKNINTNAEVLRLFDMPSKQEYLRRFHELSPEVQPDGSLSKEKVIEYVKKAFEKGYCTFEWLHQKMDGEQIPCEVYLSRIKYKNKFVVAGFTRDLRKLKAAMAKAREADERAMMMLDTAPIGVTMWDRNCNLIDFNYEAARSIGIHSKQEYRRKFFVSAPEYQPNGKTTKEMIVEFIGDTFDKGYNRTIYHHNMVGGNEIIPFDAVAFRIKYKEDYAVLVYCTDLREINAANAKMREADERAQILLDAVPMSCILFEENFKVLDCNQEALRLLKISDKQEYINNFFKTHVKVEDRDRLQEKKALETGYARFELNHIDSQGEEIPCEVTLVRVKYKGKDVLAGYARDLREFNAMIREMRKAAIAEESNKAKSKFLAAISHEIRTPMNAILGITEIQLQDEMLPASIKEAFNKIYNSGDLLLGIINDILDLSKIEMDKMEISPVKYEVASLINDTVHLNMMRNSKPIEFKLKVDENMPSMLEGDELRIKQILNNLLSNAYKYTDLGAIGLEVYTETLNNAQSKPLVENGNSQLEDEVCIVFKVSDTGQGMTKEQIDTLFTTEYTRFNLEANRTIEGTGLGMSITYHLIKIMGGSISITSEPGEGTNIIVRLPQKKVDSNILGKDLVDNLETFRVTSSVRMKKAQIIREYMPYGKILIVDDVDSNLYVAKGLMAPYGLSIDIATSGFEAVEKVKEGNVYDIIFMDHMMPKMDGMEATKIIRDLGYREPIIALTANAVVGQAKIFLENGFDEFISKPIDIRQLNSVLNKFIRNKQTPEVIAEARRQKQSQEEAVFRSGISQPDAALHGVFLLDIKKALPIIEDTLKNIDNASDEDLHLFTISVHSMKSSLANIGETIASKLAFALEKAGKERNKKAIKMQAPVLIDDIRSIRARIESERNDPYAANNVDEDPGLLREQFRLICCACADYDERPIKAALETLKKLSWKKETQNLIDKIDEQLLYGDFEEIRKIASEQL